MSKNALIIKAHTHLKKTTRSDWLSGFLVFIVALPLSLGVAVASGAPPAAGMITAVVGGILVGALAGAPFTVSGPAAGLSAFVFEFVNHHGIRALAVITVFAGIFQILLGTLKLGKWIGFIPGAVLEGVLSAIGAIIAIGQIHVLMGASVPNTTWLSITSMQTVVSQTFTQSGSFLPPVFICGVVTIFLQTLWPKIFPRFKWIPGALPAVLIATLLSLNWNMPRIHIAPLIPTIGNSVSFFFSGDWLHVWIYPFIVSGIGLALVASAETLLTARASDVLLARREEFIPCNLNQELIAQGTGNFCAGILGGIPVTAVMVRSAVNIEAGARSRFSTILHGVCMAICVVVFPLVLDKIPLTALAGILVIVGLKLINFKKWVETIRANWIHGVTWLGTVIAIMATNLLDGLGIALGLSVTIWAVEKIFGYSRRRYHRF